MASKIELRDAFGRKLALKDFEPEWDLLTGNYYEGIIACTNIHTSGWASPSFVGFNFLQFSDIHGDVVNLERIIKFKKRYDSNIDDIIFCGDMVNASWSDGIAFWGSVSGHEKILNCIGNHDSKDGGWFAKNAQACYERYIQPFSNSWGANITENKCYYYKDYGTTLRLIVLDGMHWDSAQLSFLTACLNTDRHVIIASHFPGGASVGDSQFNFDTFTSVNSGWEQDSAGYGLLDVSVPAAVDSFVDGGGHFVCYLHGHTHMDICRHLTAYQGQLMLGVTNAGIDAHVGANAASHIVRETDKRNQDSFNFISVNPELGLLTVAKIGANYDCYGRHVGTMTYDYIHNKLISQW